MDNVVMIAAVGKNGELGKNNNLIWRFHGDMKFFKEQTIHKDIVMGRKTLESLPGLLPYRKHIVLTHQDLVIPGVVTFRSKDDILRYTSSQDHDVMVIGGGSIYKLFIDDAGKMLLTEIDDICAEADVYFPSFEKNEWYRKVLGENCENNISYQHVEYVRKRSLKL